MVGLLRRLGLDALVERRWTLELQVHLRPSTMIDIGDVSKRTGLAPSTLRYYEERGLISSAGRRGLRRTFEESTLAKLTLIGLGGGARFTLDEIATMLPVAGMSRIDRERLRTRGGNRTEDSPA